VPKVRGRGHSLPRERVIDEVKKRVAAGYKEVILTGTQIGAYEKDGRSLEGLVSDILAQTGVQRIRLTSIHPQDLTPAFLSLWRDQRLCRHIHLPLQSGSDAVLERMRRRYSTLDYARAVALAREAIPDLSITTDVIVGFPGESETEFEESYRFCEDMGFAALHVFPYSPREGTPAANMPSLTRPQVKKERSARMLRLAAGSAHRFRERFVGRTLMVLWEDNREEMRGREIGGCSEVKKGLTDNYIRVYARSKGDLANLVQLVRLVAPYGSGLWAKAV